MLYSVLGGKPGWCGGQVLFKVYRHLPRAKRVKPVMVHINYHPGAPAVRTALRTALVCEGLLSCSTHLCRARR